MPQRFLRPGLITSKKWEAVSWQAQSFYIRLLTLVDDFGRYEADSTLLRSHAFPLRDDVRSSRVTELCEEIAKAGLVSFYRVDDKDYLQIEKWQERARGDRSKFPDCNGSPRLFGNPQESAADRSGKTLPSSSPSPSSLAISSPPANGASAPVGVGELQDRMRRLNRLFKRRDTTRWSDREMRAYHRSAELCPVDEFEIVEAHYRAGGEYLRRDLLTLLNNWNGEVDRARQRTAAPPRPSVVDRDADRLTRQAAQL